MIAELGTGVGKSRIIGASALRLIDELRDGKRPPVPADVTTGSLAAILGAGRAQMARSEFTGGKVVAIAAPTVSNLAHLSREFLALSRPDVQVAVLLGRGQFVSRSRVEMLLSDHPSSTVEQWLARGMPLRSDTGRAFGSLRPGLTGLVECLRACDPDFPASAAALGSDDADFDAEAYEAHCIAAQKADVLLTTHAMTCIDAMRLSHSERRGVLPPLLALLVDEAHKLEEAQAGVLSSGLHLSVLRSTLSKRDLWPGSAASVKSAATSAGNLFAALQDIGDGVQLSGPGANADPETVSHVRMLSSTLIAALKDASTPKKKQSEKTSRPPVVAVEALRSLGQLVNPKSSVHVQFSPVRKFPSVIVGPATVAPFLSGRWATTPAVLLTSGTLLLPTLQGLSHAALVRTLAIPSDRVLRCQPIHPSWLTHSPTIFLPSKSDGALCPPKPGSPGDMKAWAVEQAKVILRAAVSATGGTLILCSGYERVEALASELLPLGDRLIVQDRKTAPMSVCEDRFRSHGHRPVWIATGGAWTGLDLSDSGVSAVEDTLLTDLIVTATPFGMVRTSTHLSRVSRTGFINEKRAALMMLRQGLGRLIRREGLMHRRLWFLDGRFALPQHASLMSEVKGLMQAFANRSSL